MKEDVFNFLKAILLGFYDTVYDTILPVENNGSPPDNVCAIRFRDAGDIIRGIDGNIKYQSQPLTIICRGTKDRKASRTKAESALNALDGSHGQIYNATDIIYLAASPVIDEGVSEERGQAYHSIKVTAQFGPHNA